MNSDGEYCGQISSAQSADIVLTAGQDIVHRRCPGKLFPNDREEKRGCCSGNEPRRMAGWQVQEPRAYLSRRSPQGEDGSPGSCIQKRARAPPTGGAAGKRGCGIDAMLAPMRASALPVHHWRARFPCPCLSATPPAGGVPGLLLRYTQGAAADAALPWAIILTAPPVGGARE